MPEIAYKKRFIQTGLAERLGNKVLGLPIITSAESKFNVTLAIAPLEKNESVESGLVEMIAEKSTFDDETKWLFSYVGVKALAKMSGLRKGGLPSNMCPVYVAMDANIYNPYDTFPVHTDGNMPNDVVAVTLLGEGAEFMKVKRGSEYGSMPESSQILSSWSRRPGDAIVIRNHQTAYDDRSGLPLHAVQNGAEERVSLQIQVSYG